jgi:SPX domain protein involved in polyphosphate accumulation
MSFRKEKKYKLTFSDQNILKNKLIDKGMKILYPKRTVNSVYFDTNNLDFYLNSEEGVLPRKKIRLRWYNKDIKKISKEIKISSVEGRFKISEPFLYNENIFKNNFQLLDNEFGILKPQMQITYSREYFFFNHLRITFDSNIQYINRSSLNNIITKDKETVMEIKVNFKTNDDYIEKIIEYPTSRFSKYSRSILYTKRLI